MKTNYVIVLMAFLTSIGAYAQESKPKLVLNLGIANGYHFTPNQSPVKDYYSLGGRVNVVFHDKWFVGYTQNGSISPGNLVKDAIDFKQSRINEYALSVGRKWRMSNTLYLRSNLNIGISEFNLKIASGFDWDSDFSESKAKSSTSFLAGAEAGMGFDLNKYLAIEAGIGYHTYFKHDQLLFDTHHLNNLGFNLSLVGNINLTR